MSREVQQMFSAIARRYDVLNDVLSFGVHRLWRKKAASMLPNLEGASVLDLCAGTGDMAFALEDRVGREGFVVGVDFVNHMLELARKKKPSAVSFLQADVLSLPFDAESFDAVTISFGIRNVDNVHSCLSEIRRVLKKKGKLMVLEFGQPTLLGFREIYKFYSRRIMPFIGAAVSGDKKAYRYLPETAKEFPAGEKFVTILKEGNFQQVQKKAFLSGVAYVYSAEKGASL